MEDASVHVFEKAGLGRAPFRWVRCEVRVGPIKLGQRDGVETWVGSPGQPMGSCAYCGQGIAECHVVRSADGREFVVGCDCVYKTGDSGLRRHVNKVRTEARHEREDRQIAEGAAFVEAHREALASAVREDGRGFLAYFEWMMANAGRSGKLRVVREARRLVASGAAA